MSLETLATSISYNGNDSTEEDYPIPFVFLDAAHIRVVVTDAADEDTVLVNGTDFTVTRLDTGLGSLVTAEAYDDTNTITISRVTPKTQPMVIPDGSFLSGETLEHALDRQIMIAQETAAQFTAEAVTAHAETHASGGTDPVTLAESQVTGLTAALAAKASAAGLATHIADTANPHGVTAAQVGLGAVNNTADLDKPISTAVQAALDAIGGAWTGSEKTNDYTLVFDDGTGSVIIFMNKATANALTIPPNSSVAIGLNKPIRVVWWGAGTTSITAGVGVTVNGSSGSIALAARYKMVTLIQKATDVWLVTDGFNEGLAAHLANTSNPHSVTATQVGLGNVTNHAQTQAAIMPNTVPGSGQIPVGNGSAYVPTSVTLGLALNDFSGLRMSNNASDATNDIDITAGKCRDSTNAVDMTCAAMTKRLDANWSAGTGNGMRNSAAAITDTTYHIYAASKADGTQDYYAHTSTTIATVLAALQAETGGGSYLYLRRIGSIVRASAAILAFTQDGSATRRTYSLAVPGFDVNDTTLTTSRKTYTLASVPVGLRVHLRLRTYIAHASAGIYVTVGDFVETDAAPSITASPLLTTQTMIAGATAGVSVATDAYSNTSAQIFARSTSANTNLRIAVLGYTDDLSL